MSKDRSRRGGMPMILTISIVIQLLVFAAFWFIEPLRKSTMSIDKQELDERTEEVRERARLQDEKERAERKERKIRDEHKDALRSEEEQKRRNKIVDRVKEMERIKRDMEALKEERLVEVEQRPHEDPTGERVKEMLNQISHIDRELSLAKDRIPEDKREQLPDVDQFREQVKALQEQAETTIQAPTLENLNQLVEQTEQMKQQTEALTQKAQEHLSQEGEQNQARHHAAEADRHADRLDEMAKEINRLSPMHMNDTSAVRNQEPLAEVDTAQASTAELYDYAAKLEQRVTEDFAAARAAELAMVNEASFPETLAKLNQPQRERPDLASELQQNNLETVADLNHYRETLDDAVTQTTQMSQQAHTMMQAANGQTGQEQGQQHSQQQQLALAKAFASTATSGGNRQQVTDVSGMMRYQHGGQQTEGSQSGREGREGGAGFLPSPNTYQIKGLGNTQEIIAMALPGRKFSKESARQGWLYLDTWYVIGPFENHGRIDYTKTHPPEHLIDFDAEYPGKQDRTLRWQFTQYNTVRLTPPDEVTDSTYYGYTEVFFEEDSDMLLAIASDDAAKVWINDTLVWEDSSLSPWQLDEGFRKVFFKQGFNTVLVRLEQGPGVCHWSVLLCPPDL